MLSIGGEGGSIANVIKSETELAQASYSSVMHGRSFLFHCLETTVSLHSSVIDDRQQRCEVGLRFFGFLTSVQFDLRLKFCLYATVYLLLEEFRISLKSSLSAQSVFVSPRVGVRV